MLACPSHDCQTSVHHQGLMITIMNVIRTIVDTSLKNEHLQDKFVIFDIHIRRRTSRKVNGRRTTGCLFNMFACPSHDLAVKLAFHHDIPPHVPR